MRQSETDIPEMDKELKETQRDVTRSWERPRTDEVSRMTAIFGPTSDNREIKAMTTTSVRIKGMEIGTMTERKRVDVSTERKEDLTVIGEMLTPKLMAVMHPGVMDSQGGAMSPPGIEKRVAIKTVALKTQKMQNLGIGGTKREEVFAGQSVTGIEVVEWKRTLSGWTNLSQRSRSRSGPKRTLSDGKSV